jgi:uncharacterized protein YciI
MSQYFFLRLLPCRPSFAQDMTADERATMQQHVAYWTGLMHRSKAKVFGPVFDPAGTYGIGILEAEDVEEVQQVIAADPAAQINRYEFHPMRAILPSGNPANPQDA